MLLKISEFRKRVDKDLDKLVIDLQNYTSRFGTDEEKSWRNSLPKVRNAFSAPSFDNLDLYFGNYGNLTLEYKLPAASSWCDMILLGQHEENPSAVIIELKDWTTKGDLPGPIEGLVERHSQNWPHPSDQVRGYTEYCQRFHSAVLDRNADVHGCVIFTKDPFYYSYNLAPNDKLVKQYPCFFCEGKDLQSKLPAYFAKRLTEPNREFAEEFEQGTYKQSRGFVRQIGEQILDPKTSPFVLIDKQRNAFNLVRAKVSQAIIGNKNPKKTVIIVEGPPGSGKSVVAAKVWASLVTDPQLSDG